MKEVVDKMSASRQCGMETRSISVVLGSYVGSLNLLIVLIAINDKRFGSHKGHCLHHSCTLS
jgi:hypothetical protein